MALFRYFNKANDQPLLPAEEAPGDEASASGSSVPVDENTDIGGGGPTTVKPKGKTPPVHGKITQKTKRKWLEDPRFSEWLVFADGHDASLTDQSDSDGAMFCKICRDAGKINQNPTTSSHPLWKLAKSARGNKNNAFITGCKNYQRSALVRHIDSDDHKDSINVLMQQTSLQEGIEKARKQAEEAVRKQHKDHEAQLRTMYFMVKHNISTNIYNDLIKLQVANGAQNLDHAYTSHTSHEDLEDAIFNCVFENIKTEIQDAPCVGVMLDETTDITVKKKLVVCLRLVNKEGVPQNYLIANKVVDAGNAPTILAKLEEILRIYGIDMVRVVSLGTDGASVMVGRKNGLGKKMKDSGCKYLTQTHCAAHRLNLAASGAAKNTEYLKDYDRLVSSLHSFYVHSTNRYDGLRSLQEIMHGEISALHTPTAVRWLSLQSTVSAILKSWPAIVLSLEAEAKKDAKAKGLLNKIKTQKFLLVTALLSDVLIALGILSRSLQKKDLDISDMYLALETTIESLTDMQITEKNCVNMSSSRAQMKRSDGKLVYEHVNVVQQERETSIKIQISPTSDSLLDSLRVGYIGRILSNIKERFHMVSDNSTPVDGEDESGQGDGEVRMEVEVNESEDVEDRVEMEVNESGDVGEESVAVEVNGSGNGEERVVVEINESGNGGVEVEVNESGDGVELGMRDQDGIVDDVIDIEAETGTRSDCSESRAKYRSDLSDFELLKVMDLLFNPKHLHNTTREQLADHGLEELNVLLRKYDGMRQFFGDKEMLDPIQARVNFSKFKHTLRSLQVTSGKSKSKQAPPSMTEAGRLMYRFRDSYPNIMTIMVICMTQVVTSVMCEQEFSKQNWIKSKSRNRLAPDRVEKQMFIKTNSPEDINDPSINWARMVAVFNEEKIRRKPRLPFCCF